MFERQQRTADQRLAEFVPEVGRPVRSLDQNLLGRLVKPRTRIEHLLPFASPFRTRIRSHVNRRSGQRQRSLATAQTVADLTARTRSGPVERFHRRREVMRFSLQRKHRRDFLHFIEIRFVATGRSKLLDDRTFVERYIIFIGRNQFIGIFRRCFLDQGKKRAFLFFAIDDKGTAENLMTAVFGIDLRETENLAISQLAADFLADLLQVGNLFGTQRQPFLLVVSIQIIDIDNRVGLLVDSKNLLIQPVVNTLQHRVVFGLARGNREIFLNTGNAFQPHILSNFYRVRTPRRNHLTARTHEPSI